jgi:hypothetical protein
MALSFAIGEESFASDPRGRRVIELIVDPAGGGNSGVEIDLPQRSIAG